MLSYEVILNGEKIAVAGMEDWAVLSVIISATRGDPETRKIDHTLDIGGLTEDSCHTRWGGAELAIGSEVLVRIVDCATPDVPTKRYRFDGNPTGNDLSDDEKRAMRYQDYLELKAEFEQ